MNTLGVMRNFVVFVVDYYRKITHSVSTFLLKASISFFWQ